GCWPSTARYGAADRSAPVTRPGSGAGWRTPTRRDPRGCSRCSLPNSRNSSGGWAWPGGDRALPAPVGLPRRSPRGSMPRRPVEGTAASEEPDEHLHWRIEPLPAGTVVVDRPRPAPRAADPLTTDLTGALSRQSFEQELAFLAGLPTRHSLSAGFRQAADQV